jgi:hypothetical protein
LDRTLAIRPRHPDHYIHTVLFDDDASVLSHCQHDLIHLWLVESFQPRASAALLLRRSRKLFEQDFLNFNEPPDSGLSMRLHLGAAVLKAGRVKDAEAVYREDLRDLQEDEWALFGLWQSLRAQAGSAEAPEIRGRFERAWKNADVILSASVF